MAINRTEQVRLAIIQGILTGKYELGGRIPAEREATQLTGTSRITVRRAYEELAAAGIITRQPVLGTRVASAFRGATETPEQLGLIATPANEFASRFITAICRRTQERDAILSLSIPDEDTGAAQLELAIKMASRGIRNLILWGADSRFDWSAFARLRILGINLVFFDQILPGPYADFIGLDNRRAVQLLLEAARRATPRLKALRYLGFADSVADSNREREEAFLAGAARAEVLRLPRQATDAEIKAMRDALLALPRPAAVLSVNAPVLATVFDAPPPAGLRLYCVDDTPRVRALGAVRCAQPIDEMGKAAVDALFAQQKAGAAWKPRQKRFAPELL